MADVLTFALAVIAPAMSLTPVLVSFGSLLGYHAYLKMRYLLPMRYGSLAMVTALVLTTGYVAHCLNTGKKQLTNTEDLI
jgi:hypothetical protein